MKHLELEPSTVRSFLRLSEDDCALGSRGSRVHHSVFLLLPNARGERRATCYRPPHRGKSLSCGPSALVPSSSKPLTRQFLYPSALYR
jgi:hypothetical protein